jgi:hypothetical protein
MEALPGNTGSRIETKCPIKLIKDIASDCANRHAMRRPLRLIDASQTSARKPRGP